MPGIIDNRTCRRMILRESQLMNSINKIISFYVLKEETILELLGFRIALEIDITDLIFNNIMERDIKELEDIKKIQHVISGNKLTIESELTFHINLYQISQNKIP